jgi:hypothetical protein
MQLELKKQIVYNYCATILWVLQLLCNYLSKNIEKWQINCHVRKLISYIIVTSELKNESFVQ